MLLEREGQLAALRDHLDAAGVGDGSLVLVAGEAGAGKTSLIDAFVESLDHKTLVIQGACDPLTTPRPLGPLHDFAADSGSGLSDLAVDAADPFQMFESVLDRLKSTVRPILMVIEDIHWADDATLDFLRFVGRRVADAKSVVVCTYRDDEVGPDHPLRPVLGQLIPLPTTDRLIVPPLTIEAVRRLVSGHEVDPDALIAITDGNAFFVTEVLAAGYVVPDTVQEAVLSRVARLDESPRRVVEAVSIAPRSLDVEHAMAMVGGAIGHVDAALAAGVLIGDGRSLRFRHELARSSVEDSLPPGRRLSLHLRMLRLLDEDPNPDLARMAHHAIRAGDSERIIEHAPQAAREASRRGAHREAISFLEAAIKEIDRSGQDDLAARLRIDLAEEYKTIDQTRKAIGVAEEAVAYFREAREVGELGLALTTLSRLRWRVNEDRLGMEVLNEALSLPYDDSENRVLAEAYAQLAYLLMLGRHGSEGRRALTTARAIAGEDITTDLAWDMDLLDSTLRIVMGDSQQGVDGLTESLWSARKLGDPGRVALALSMLGSGGGEVRLYPESVAALKESIEHGLAHDEDYSVAYSRSWLARIAHERGQWDEAVRHAELVEATTTQVESIAYVTAMSALGRVRVRRGDPGGISLLDELADEGAHHELQHIWNTLCGRSEYHWLRGRPESGLDLLKPAFERALDTESEWARGEIGYWMWKAGEIDGPPEGAAEPFALQMSGRWREAAQTWREIGCPYEVGLSLAEGDVDAMKEALEVFDSLEARPMADRVRSQLREIGVESIPRGPLRSTRENPAGLTNRQVEVLELMADGLANAEIAEKLFISKKTVEHHVSAIYTKLGVDSRTKATATLHQQK
ncbi:MAG TPA: AAA family ATPase [Acidimicrobiia bacterium]